MSSIVRNICKLRFVLQRSMYASNILIRTNMSAVAAQYDELPFHYENTPVLTDTYSPCWYCKGTGYVACIFCEDGCSHCNQTKSTPCPFCNKKKFSSDFIILTGLN